MRGATQSSWTSPFVLAAGAAAWFAGLAFVFHAPARIGQDPYGYFDLAESLARGRGFTHSPPWEDFVPSFAPGYPGVLALLFVVAGSRADFARALTLLIAAACPALLAAVVAREQSRLGAVPPGVRATPFVAGAFLAACPLLARSSLTLMSDGLAVATLLAAAAGALAFARAPSAMRGAALGLLSTFSFAVRYATAPVVLLLVLVSAAWAVKRPNTKVAAALLALAGVAAIAGAFIVALVGWKALATHPVGSQWRPVNAFASYGSVQNPADGRLTWGMPLVLAYAIDAIRPGIVNPALVLAAIAGAIAGPRSIVRASLAWVAASMLLVLGLPEHNPRFWMLSLPALAVLGALGVACLGKRAHRVLACVIVIGVGLVGSAREARRMGGQAAAEEARIGLVQNVLREEGSLRVFTLELSPSLAVHVPSAEIWEAYAPNDVAWDAALSREGRCLLLLPDGAGDKWQGSSTWERVERALVRDTGHRESAGGAVAIGIACGKR